MNVRFLRASYTPPSVGSVLRGHQYYWNYYGDAILSLQFFEAPAGSFSGSAEEIRAKAAALFEESMVKGGAEKVTPTDTTIDGVAAKDYEIIQDGKKVLGRTFIHNDVWYVLIAQATIKQGEAAIQKAFSSFKFVKP